MEIVPQTADVRSHSRLPRHNRRTVQFKITIETFVNRKLHRNTVTK